MDRKSWLDDETQTPLIDTYAMAPSSRSSISLPRSPLALILLFSIVRKKLQYFRLPMSIASFSVPMMSLSMISKVTVSLLVAPRKPPTLSFQFPR